MINPQLMGGLISPPSTVVNSGTSPGELTGTTATGGTCSGSYSYQWQSSTDGTNFTPNIQAPLHKIIPREILRRVDMV